MMEEAEPQWLSNLKELADPTWITLLSNPGGAAILAKQLPSALSTQLVATDGTKEREVWEWTGLCYRANERWYDAIVIYESMYYHFLKYQQAAGGRVHKGMPLVWLVDCYAAVQNVPISKRYLMLTLIEDAITMDGAVEPVKTGSYFRLAWRHGLPDIEVKRYSSESFAIHERNPSEALFPEYVLQELDKAWLVEVPSPSDVGIYIANTIYVEHLVSQLGEGTGKALENLADYLVSCIPGCRTARRKGTYSTDLDIVCALQGPDVDFRSDFGRYFICECKDWKSPVGFSEFAKFARVLDSIKAKFGIIFSREGITGTESTEDTRREQLKVYQDRGLVIIVVDNSDLEYVSQGGNFIALLRDKYEQVRLDLPRQAPSREHGT